MDDLISRQAAIDLIEHDKIGIGSPFISLPRAQVVNRTCDRHVEGVKNLPSAQKTGRWQITDAYPHNVYCSECNARFAQTHWAVWEDGSLPRNYCPNCGAKMEDNNA